jgi:hypothetical protein
MRWLPTRKTGRRFWARLFLDKIEPDFHRFQLSIQSDAMLEASSKDRRTYVKEHRTGGRLGVGGWNKIVATWAGDGNRRHSLFPQIKITYDNIR